VWLVLCVELACRTSEGISKGMWVCFALCGCVSRATRRAVQRAYGYSVRFHSSPPLLVVSLHGCFDLCVILRNDNDSCIVVIVVAIHCIFARNTRARSGPGHPARRSTFRLGVGTRGNLLKGLFQQLGN
jgi:hypothetical protein